VSTPQQITLSQAAEAVYVDFEGNVDQAPSILGVRHAGTTRQYVIEAELASFSDLANPKYDMTVATLEQALAKLRELAAGRVVAGFTTHELNVVATHCVDADLRTWFAASYVNVKRPIGRWLRRQSAAGKLPVAADGTLLAYMTVAGYSYKPGCGPGIVGPGLTRVRGQVARHGSAADTPKGARLHWWRILSHNATDLEATQGLTVRSLTEDQ
jgi:hypothetical protein